MRERPLGIVIATQHFFAPIYRNAGMHQFARALAGRGHRIDFITVGQSLLKQRTKPATRRYAESAGQAVREGANPANIHAHVHRELVHPPSGSRRMERLTAPLHHVYGRLDPVFRAAAAQADVVILECGYPLYFYAAVRRLNPRAIMVAFYNDRLELVGFRPEILALHRRLMPRFDFVRTNAERLLGYLPAGTNGHYVPQGVDKARMCFDGQSPYAPGTRNIVSVGDMLFDEGAIRAIAAAAAKRGATLHVIGAQVADPPANLVVHGEMPFERTLPYIVHADAGVAPYRLVESADYLAQSSLKIQQYSYCGLPVLLARGLEIRGENFIYYDPADAGDIDAAVDRALSMPRDRRYGAHLLGWDEVGAGFERQLRDLVAAGPAH